MYEYFEDAKYVWLVTEYCKGGDLFDRVIEKETFTEEEACAIFR